MHVFKLLVVPCAGGLMLASWIGQASAQNNPDLLDGGLNMTDTADPKDKGGLEVVGANRSVYVFGFGQQDRTVGTAGARLIVHIYEPDKLLRKSNAATAQQKTHAEAVFSFSNNTTNFGLSGVAPLCGGQVKIKDADSNGVYDEAKWKFKCNDPAATMTALGLSSTQQSKFLAAFGPDLEIQGQGP